MNQKELQNKREQLEKKLKSKENAHAQKFNYIASESAYRDSCKEISVIYKELFEVCMELGDPIPVIIKNKSS